MEQNDGLAIPAERLRQGICNKYESNIKISTIIREFGEKLIHWQMWVTITELKTENLEELQVLY